MKKFLPALGAVCLAVLISTASITAHKGKYESTSAKRYETSYSELAITADKSSETVVNDQKTEEAEVPAAQAEVPASEKKEEPKIEETKTVAVQPAQPQQPAKKAAPAPSRGAAPAPKSKTELLDWWKSAQYAFPIGSTATVKDVYTGRTFQIKRTMGANHADCEALTKADTEIIKSVWGGFTWTARPVHIIINGRVLAASMSSMPHAGVDSAPAFKVVDNRSVGYGRGENLDVIKGNGMDGHFDIHFLNSTRHKDGKIDYKHQDAIRVAASR